MPTACDIEFRNNVVYAGQELYGTVRLTLTEEKHLRGIYVQICGKGYCKWVEGRTTFIGQENYLHQTIYFIGGDDGRSFSIHMKKRFCVKNFFLNQFID